MDSNKDYSSVDELIDNLLSKSKLALKKKKTARLIDTLDYGIHESCKLYYSGKTAQAIQVLQTMLEILEGTDQKSAYLIYIAKINYEIGLIQTHEGKSEIAEEHFSKILDLPQDNFSNNLLNWFKKKRLTSLELNFQKIVIDILNASAINARRKRMKDSLEICKELAFQALKQAKEINYIQGEIKSTNILAMSLMYQGNFDEMLEFSDKSLELHNKLEQPDYNLQGEIFCIKFTAYFNKGENDKALESCFKAEEMYRKAGNKIELPNILRYKAEILRRKGDYKTARNDYETIINNFKDIISESNLVITYLSLGGLYFEIGEIERALDCLDIVLAKRPDPNQGRAAVLSSMAKINHYQGKIINAESLFREAIDIFRKLPYRAEGTFNTLVNYFRLLLDKHKFEDESDKYFVEAEEILEEIRSEISSESPYSQVIGLYVESVYEMSRDNLYNANLKIKKAMEIYNSHVDLDKKLILDLYLHLTEIALERFRLQGRNLFFKEALENISIAEDIAQNAGVFASLIDIKRIQAELFISILDWDNALKSLQEALVISSEKELYAFQKSLESRIFYVLASKEEQIGRPTKINVDDVLYSIRTALGLPSIDQTRKLEIVEDDFIFVSYFLDSKIGTKKQSALIPRKYRIEIENIDALLNHQGTLSMILLGQGNTYTKGLFILPCSKIFGERNKLVYGFTISNPDDPSLRGRKAAYSIIEIIFPKQYDIYLSSKKNDIEDILDNQVKAITDVKLLTDTFLTELKDMIIQQIS
jgi:tetratricopeptide (TPR) repeat protein